VEQTDGSGTDGSSSVPLLVVGEVGWVGVKGVFVINNQERQRAPVWSEVAFKTMPFCLLAYRIHHTLPFSQKFKRVTIFK